MEMLSFYEEQEVMKKMIDTHPTIRLKVGKF
jgi:hypothetical protein